jgi:hypothetical protein
MSKTRRSEITIKVDISALRKAAKILSSWDSQDPLTRERYQAAWEKPQAKMQPLINAVRAAERLTQRDFEVRINTRA